MDSYLLTVERAERRAERDAKAGQMTETELSVASRYLEDYAKLTEEMWASLVPAEVRSRYAPIGSHLVALCAVSAGMRLVADTVVLSAIVDVLGRALEAERYGYEMRNWDAIWAKKTEDEVKKAHRCGKSRKTAMRALASKKGFGFKKATGKEIKKLGWWMFNILISGPLFQKDDEGFLVLSEEGAQVSHDVHTHVISKHPVHIPQKMRPQPWTGPTMQIDGYHMPLVRTHHKMVQRVVSEAIKAGHMNELLKAVSSAQDVEWKVNQEIPPLVEWCFANGYEIGNVPPREDIPQRPVGDSPTEDQLKVWKRNEVARRERNRSFIGNREQLKRDLATAEWIGEDSFWTPCNLDYRGRMYCSTMFNFQRGDYVRAMFKFSSPKELGEHGLYWLKVHVANCWAGAISKEDKRKTDKVSFDERVAWVDDNCKRLREVATNPRGFHFWMDADAPFMFVAACKALERAKRTGYCDIPVSFDGSCSGLQHLGAMTRDENTARLVNLSMSAEPEDVYAEVARKVHLEACNDWSRGDVLAGICVANGINRSLVKRNVMTFCYGSKQRGMRDQLWTDVMVPLRYKVMSGELAAHPYGDDNGAAAATYLAKLIFETIKGTVRRPYEAMVFLQGVARALAHEEKPIIWHTPLGLPVVHYKPVRADEKISLFLNDRGVRKTTTVVLPQYGTKIDKVRSANGIAPSFVHSLDANHLHCVTLACAEEGITDLALVHDSFGCQAGDAERLRGIIQEEFRNQYDDHDVLLDIMREAAEQLDTKWDTLPMLPSRGDYDINSIMEADYAFA